MKSWLKFITFDFCTTVRVISQQVHLKNNLRYSFSICYAPLSSLVIVSSFVHFCFILTSEVFFYLKKEIFYIVSAYLKKTKSAKCLTEVPERLAKGPRSFRAQSAQKSLFCHAQY